MSKDSVAKPVEEYQQAITHWNLTRDLRGGTPAMRRARTTYLPMEREEPQDSYDARVDRSVLTNLYTKTADKLCAKPLKKPISVGEDVPPEVAQYLDDIDSNGTRLDVFAKDLLKQAIDDGITHILVEFPKTQDSADGEVAMADGTRALSLRQAQERNVRPFARHVAARDLIGWKFETVNGKKRLMQIRIKETATVDMDEFTQAKVQRIRVYEPDQWRLFEQQESKDKGSHWVEIDRGVNTLGEIPLVSLFTNRTGYMIGRPWLEDIAWLNVAHWQSDSDQRNLLHIARVPVLFAKGFGEDENNWSISLGSNSFVKGPGNSDLKYVEHSGKGIEAGRQDLQDIEARIQQLGLEMLIKRPSGNTTATARAMDQAEADSALAQISQELENCLERVLDYFAKWLELEAGGGGSLSVFKDFSIELAEGSEIESLFKMRQAGEISRQTFLKEISRRGLLGDDFNAQTEIDLLDLEGGNSAAFEIGEEEETRGRNEEGDYTEEVEGHRHVLEANGRMSTETDAEGNSHTHEWNPLDTRSSVEAGHSHVLLARSAATKKAPPPGLEQPGVAPDDEEDDG